MIRKSLLILSALSLAAIANAGTPRNYIPFPAPDAALSPGYAVPAWYSKAETDRSVKFGYWLIDLGQQAGATPTSIWVLWDGNDLYHFDANRQAGR